MDKWISGKVGPVPASVQLSVKGDPESPRRKYTVLGKEKLSDVKWQEDLSGAKIW